MSRRTSDQEELSLSSSIVDPPTKECTNLKTFVIQSWNSNMRLYQRYMC